MPKGRVTQPNGLISGDFKDLDSYYGTGKWEWVPNTNNQIARPIPQTVYNPHTNTTTIQQPPPVPPDNEIFHQTVATATEKDPMQVLLKQIEDNKYMGESLAQSDPLNSSLYWQEALRLQKQYQQMTGTYQPTESERILELMNSAIKGRDNSPDELNRNIYAKTAEARWKEHEALFGRAKLNSNEMANYLNSKGISSQESIAAVNNPDKNILANYLNKVGIATNDAIAMANNMEFIPYHTESDELNRRKEIVNQLSESAPQGPLPREEMGHLTFTPSPSITLPASQPVSQPPPASQPSQPQSPPWLTSHQAFIDELNRRLAEHDREHAREYEDTIRELQQQQARNPIEKQALQHIQYLHDPTYRHAFESILGPFTNMQNQLQQIGLGQQMTTFPRPRKRDRVGEVMSHLDENMYVTGFDEEPPYFKKRRYLE